MRGKLLALLMALMFFCGYALVAAPTVTSITDANKFYPSAGATGTIRFTITDADTPGDVNVWVYTVERDTSAAGDRGTKTLISTNVGANAMNFCTTPTFTAAASCAYTWTVTANLDANYFFDVNVMDITTGDDANATSSVASYVDTNACDTGYSITNDQVTLTTVCSGWGMDENGGSEQTFYNKSRQGRCADNFGSYSAPFGLTFGEFTICYYSRDGLGNTETTVGFTHTADSDAYDIALLTEIALAGLLLFAILSAIIIRREDLSPALMVALTVAACAMAIAILIFAVVL